MKPTAFDIIHAIEMVDRGDWIDPVVYPDDYWACDVYDANGMRIGNGCGFSTGEAMGLAWICAWYPDALIDGRIPHNDIVPYCVPDGCWPRRQSAMARSGAGIAGPLAAEMAQVD